MFMMYLHTFPVILRPMTDFLIMKNGNQKAKNIKIKIKKIMSLIEKIKMVNQEMKLNMKRNHVKRKRRKHQKHQNKIIIIIIMMRMKTMKIHVENGRKNIMVMHIIMARIC